MLARIIFTQNSAQNNQKPFDLLWHRKSLHGFGRLIDSFEDRWSKIEDRRQLLPTQRIRSKKITFVSLSVLNHFPSLGAFLRSFLVRFYVRFQPIANWKTKSNLRDKLRWNNETTLKPKLKPRSINLKPCFDRAKFDYPVQVVPDSTQQHCWRETTCLHFCTFCSFRNHFTPLIIRIRRMFT